MYGEAPDNATVLETTDPSVALPTCETWPRSGDACPPPKCLSVFVDTDKNGVPDHMVMVLVGVDDVNNNGRFDAGIDRLVFSPDRLERLDRRVPLCFTPADWRQSIREAQRQL